MYLHYDTHIPTTMCLRKFGPGEPEFSKMWLCKDLCAKGDAVEGDGVRTASAIHVAGQEVAQGSTDVAQIANK